MLTCVAAVWHTLICHCTNMYGRHQVLITMYVWYVTYMHICILHSTYTLRISYMIMWHCVYDRYWWDTAYMIHITRTSSIVCVSYTHCVYVTLRIWYIFMGHCVYDTYYTYIVYCMCIIYTQCVYVTLRIWYIFMWHS